MSIHLHDPDKVQELRRMYPAGTRIKLVEMDDVQAPPAGTLGTVQFVDDAGNIIMRWDNGSGLSLIEGVDRFEKV